MWRDWRADVGVVGALRASCCAALTCDAIQSCSNVEFAASERECRKRSHGLSRLVLLQPHCPARRAERKLFVRQRMTLRVWRLARLYPNCNTHAAPWATRERQLRLTPQSLHAQQLRRLHWAAAAHTEPAAVRAHCKGTRGASAGHACQRLQFCNPARAWEHKEADASANGRRGAHRE